MTNDRFERGTARLAEIHGRAGEAVIAGLADLAPDLGRYIIEFGFGDVYSRPGLDLKTRELATVAALTVMGNARQHLEVHLAAALNVGATREEIRTEEGCVGEGRVRSGRYRGWPTATKKK